MAESGSVVNGRRWCFHAVLGCELLRRRKWGLLGAGSDLAVIDTRVASSVLRGKDSDAARTRDLGSSVNVYMFNTDPVVSGRRSTSCEIKQIVSHCDITAVS